MMAGKRRWYTGIAILFLICLTVFWRPVEAKAVSGQEIVNFAMGYVGKVPYVWGGNSFSSGMDCSGFVCGVYNQFGINLWSYRTKIRNSPLVTNIGTDLNQAKPGDILWFEGHVGIYTGKVNGTHYMVNETRGTYKGITDNVIYSPVSINATALMGILAVSGVDGTPAPVNSSWTYNFTTKSDTDATLKATFLSGGKGSYTAAGIRIWKKWNGQYVGGKDESCSHNMSNPSAWYDVNKELGVSLQPGVTYTVQFYITFNGRENWSDKKDYTSSGTCPHSWEYQSTTKNATVFEEGSKSYRCSICGNTGTAAIPKLTPTISLNTTSVSLRHNSTAQINVSSLAAGDYVSGWSSANSAVATVSSGGLIRPGTMSGSTYVTVTLASGKTASVSVYTDLSHTHQWVDTGAVTPATVLANGSKVQKCSVCGQTQSVSLPKLAPSIQLNKTSIALRRNRSFQLIVSGLARGDSVASYRSQNPSVATVSSEGRIRAGKKTGKTTVTVTLRSGKTAVVAVKVNRVKKVSSVKVKAYSGKRIKVTWKRLPGMSGYQIRYSTSKKWKNGSVLKVRASKSGKWFKVKRKGTFYIKVRAYKSVNGVKYCGRWSAVKTVRVR